MTDRNLSWPAFFVWNIKTVRRIYEKKNNKPHSRASKLHDEHFGMKRNKLTSIPNLMLFWLDAIKKNEKNKEEWRNSNWSGTTLAMVDYDLIGKRIKQRWKWIIKLEILSPKWCLGKVWLLAKIKIVVKSALKCLCGVECFDVNKVWIFQQCLIAYMPLPNIQFVSLSYL